MSFENDLLAILPRLRRFAVSLSRDRADADDLCQAALERGLRAREQWQPGTRLDSWMYRIMRNLWIDEGRSRQRAVRTFAPEEAGEHVGYAGDQHVEAHVMLSDVDRAMQALPDEQREAIALVLVEGLSYGNVRSSAPALLLRGSLLGRVGGGAFHQGIDRCRDAGIDG